MIKKTLFIDYPENEITGRIANRTMWGITIISIILMIISSVKRIELKFYDLILVIEFLISCIFLIDLIIRAHLSDRKLSFFTNIFNIFDILASVPFIVAFWFHGYFALWYLKILRIARICRIFRLGKYLIFLSTFKEALIKNAYKYKIAGVFFLLCRILGSFMMYIIEGNFNPWFWDIPSSMWRTVVTMATVGYGDVYPTSVLGKIAGTIIILFGPIFLAIVSSVSIVTFLDVVKIINKEKTGKESLCEKCAEKDYEKDSQYCRICWTKLSSSTPINYNGL